MISDLAETVRDHDPDRYLLSMFAPEAARAGLFALYAFNHEIARTREVVTDTRLGLIRLQWWRDTLDKIYAGGGYDPTPLNLALADIISSHRLPRDLFDQMIYAREFDLEDRQPSSLAGMKAYAELTHVPLMRLAQMVLGQEEDESVLGNVATAYALTGLLRAVPFHLSQRRCYLPADLVTATDALYGGTERENLYTAVARVRDMAQTLLREASSKTKTKSVQLHAKLAQIYLAQIKSCGDDVFAPRLQVPPFARELRLWWAAAF